MLVGPYQSFLLTRRQGGGTVLDGPHRACTKVLVDHTRGLNHRTPAPANPIKTLLDWQKVIDPPRVSRESRPIECLLKWIVGMSQRILTEEPSLLCASGAPLNLGMWFSECRPHLRDRDGLYTGLIDLLWLGRHMLNASSTARRRNIVRRQHEEQQQ